MLGFQRLITGPKMQTGTTVPRGGDSTIEAEWLGIRPGGSGRPRGRPPELNELQEDHGSVWSRVNFTTRAGTLR